MIPFIQDEVFQEMSLDKMKQFLIDIISVLPDDQITLLHSELENAGVFEAVNDDDKLTAILQKLSEE